jgi:cytidylate kinase
MTKNVILSGLTAAGKTTHCHILAGEYGLQYVSSSQVLLSLLNMFPIQERDFWITDEAQKLWKTQEATKVDEELLRLESKSNNIVFDTIAMPWLHQHESFCVWLESSLESRVMKAIVSLREKANLTPSEIERRIQLKDETACADFKGRFGFDLLNDRTPFALILDISRSIKEPTLESSLNSVKEVHEFIRPALGWYLTGDSVFISQFKYACLVNKSVIVLHTATELAG